MGCCKHRGGSRSSPSLPCAGEEEDGDEDDEAEGATGKRAAEDDEVGRAPLVSRVGFGVESVGSEAPGWALGPGSCPCGSCCVCPWGIRPSSSCAGLAVITLGLGSQCCGGMGQGCSGPKASCQRLCAVGNTSAAGRRQNKSRGTQNLLYFCPFILLSPPLTALPFPSG